MIFYIHNIFCLKIIILENHNFLIQTIWAIRLWRFAIKKWTYCIKPKAQASCNTKPLRWTFIESHVWSSPDGTFWHTTSGTSLPQSKSAHRWVCSTSPVGWKRVIMTFRLIFFFNFVYSSCNAIDFKKKLPIIQNSIGLHKIIA